MDNNSKQNSKDLFAKRFKKALEANNLEHLTYKKLGEFFNTTDMAVHNWLSGKSIPAMTRLPEIAQKLSVSIEYLIAIDLDNGNYVKEELKLVNNYRKLSEQQKQTIGYIIEEFIH
jgi:transcriptional regulator with XRE-family HTH domain